MLIYPYNPKSASAKVLSKALSARRIKHNSTTFIGRARKKVINWGACNVPDEVMKCQVWNHPHSVEVCADKQRIPTSSAVHCYVPTVAEVSWWPLNLLRWYKHPCILCMSRVTVNGECISLRERCSMSNVR